MFMPNKSTGNSDELGHIGFNAGKARKKALRLLSAELDYPNETELLKALIDEKLKSHLPDELRAIKEQELKKQPAAH